jgi:ubiquinone biosynthesis protein UbiJ
MPLNTEGITKDDVAGAMEFLNMHNPKPEIPLEITVSGHEIVAVARRVAELEARLDRLESKS